MENLLEIFLIIILKRNTATIVYSFANASNKFFVQYKKKGIFTISIHYVKKFNFGGLGNVRYPLSDSNITLLI